MRYRFWVSLMAGVLCSTLCQGYGEASNERKSLSRSGKGHVLPEKHIHARSVRAATQIMEVEAPVSRVPRWCPGQARVVDVKVKTADGTTGHALVTAKPRKVARYVVEKLGPLVGGMDASDPRAIDDAMMQGHDSGALGPVERHAMFGLSMALHRLAASKEGINDAQLYRYIAGLHGTEAVVISNPLVTAVRGGPASGSSVDVREINLVATGAAGVSQAYRRVNDVLAKLSAIVRDSVAPVGETGSGGFALSGYRVEDALRLVTQAIAEANQIEGVSLTVHADATAHYYGNGMYAVRQEDGRAYRNGKQMAAEWARLVADYPIISLTDGVAASDFEGWRALRQMLGGKVQLVGGALFGSDAAKIRTALEGDGKATSFANAVMVVPPESGTVTHAVRAILEAQSRGLPVLIDSGGAPATPDPFIAHLGAGTNVMGSNYGPWVGLTELVAIQKAMFSRAKHHPLSPKPQFAADLGFAP